MTAKRILELVYEYLCDCGGESERSATRGATRWISEYGNLTTGVDSDEMIDMSNMHIRSEGWPESRFSCVEDALEYMASMQIAREFESAVEGMLDDVGGFDHIVTRLPNREPDDVLENPSSGDDVLVYIEDGEVLALCEKKIGDSRRIWFDVTDEMREQVMDKPLLCLRVAAEGGGGGDEE